MKLAGNPLLFLIRLISLCLACAAPSTALAQLQTTLLPIVRTDREYFVCDDAVREQSCFDQYVAFTDQYVPTGDPTVAIEDLRCASFGSERSDATFSLSGRLVERAAGQALSLSPRILKIRFYSKGASGEPIELPRSDLTYVLARTLTESKLLSETTTGKVVNNMEISAIQQKKWSKLTSTDQVDLAVTQLQTWGWLRRVVHSTGGRPSPAIRLNPALPIDA